MDKYGSYNYIFTSPNGLKIVGSRTSIDPAADHLLTYKALEFRDAAARQDMLFICDFVPKWKRVFLKLLGIQYEEKIT